MTLSGLVSIKLFKVFLDFRVVVQKNLLSFFICHALLFAFMGQSVSVNAIVPVIQNMCLSCISSLGHIQCFHVFLPPISSLSTIGHLIHKHYQLEQYRLILKLSKKNTTNNIQCNCDKSKTISSIFTKGKIDIIFQFSIITTLPGHHPN